MKTRYLLVGAVFLLSIAAVHALVAYNPQGCSLNTYRYDERTAEPLACLDAANYDGNIVLLLRNQEEETLTLNSVVVQPGNYYAYAESYAEGSASDESMVAPQAQPAVCPLGADQNKDGVAEPIAGIQLQPGASLIVSGPCAGISADYNYNSLQVTYTEPNGRISNVTGSAYLTPTKKATLSALSPLVFIPVIVLVILAVYIVLAALRARRKAIIMGGKQ